MRPSRTRGVSRLLIILAAGSTLGSGCQPADVPERNPASSDRGESANTADPRAVLLDPSNAAWFEVAPDTYRVLVETTAGDFVIEAVRAWAPIGADRFYNLVRNGYYDDARFHRIVPDFIVQWGIAGDPTVSAVWYDRGMPDDPVAASNERGTIAYAFTQPGTRSTQLFISVVDNTRLDEQGFAPFGRIVEGMESVVDSIYSGYGEASGGGVRAGDQSRLVTEGNAYLDEVFPELDRLIRASVLEN